MTIPPIAPISSIAPLGATAGAAATGGAQAPDFSSAISNAMDSLQQTQSTASSNEAQLAAGQGSLPDTMIAASEASLETQVTNDILTKAITSYNDIANMSF